MGFIHSQVEIYAVFGDSHYSCRLNVGDVASDEARNR